MINSFIFTCSTGRCGTAYLANLFNGEHEPQPKLMQANNRVLSDMSREVAANGNEKIAREYLSNTKLPHIRRTCFKPVYFETAHTFSKGYLLPMIELLGNKIKVVRLRRNPKAIANSLLRLGTIPPYQGWYLRGTDKVCIDRITDHEWSLFSNQEKCAWYVNEIENQWTHIIRPRLSEQQRFEVKLEEILYDNPVLRELESFIGLPLVVERVGQSINARR